MAASVLGKRSRVIGEDSQLPPRKRTTRSSTPAIFEDGDILQSAHLADVRLSTRATATSRKTKSNRSKLNVKWPSTTTKDVEIQDAPSLSEADHDENLPPIDTQILTPSTTRFKDVLHDTPSTPKHRVRALGGLLTPRTPKSINTTRIQSQNVYTRARQLFTQSNTPTKLIGRDGEREQLHRFIDGAKASCQGGCTYISGPPGTGKSAIVQEVLQDLENDSELRISIINCVGIRTAAQVYGKILEDLAPSTVLGKTSAESHLRKLFTKKASKLTYLVVLDEVDSLVDVECETLYTIFEWALQPSSSLAMVGIANALDLTDRFLPRLKSRGMNPHLLPFLPYTGVQISAIITSKLRSLLSKESEAAADFTPCLHPTAIQLCGKKIASQTGDLRKAFSLVRRAIDHVEKDALAKRSQSSPSKQPLGEVTNSVIVFDSPPNTLSSKASLGYTPETAPRATIAHMAKLASSMFNNGTISRLSGLNLQQKAVLCSIVSKEHRRQQQNPFITPTKNSNKAPTVAELFSKYTSLCKRDDGILQPLKDTEFRDVVASLETLGLVHESKARSSSLLTPTSSSRNRNNDERQIASAITEKEMRDSLSGPGADLLMRLLHEM